MRVAKSCYELFVKRLLSLGGIAIVTVLTLTGCGGTVANLSSGTSGASVVQILTTSLSDVQIGDFAFGIATAGGFPPLKFAVSAGELPKGTTLDSSTGVISGTIPPSAANSH
jgi:hypothetical protein